MAETDRKGESGLSGNDADYEKPRIEHTVDAEELSREALYAGNGTPIVD